MERSGVFITLEGPEGGGKTAQFERIVRQLREEGYEVVAAREPGGTELGEKIRAVLLNPQGPEMGSMSELLSFEAARSNLVIAVIRPALMRGAIVVCDRFSDSSTAYQGYGRGLSIEDVQELNTIAARGLIPDLTILLDLPVEAGIKRKRGTSEFDRLDQEELEFHQRVRAGYLEMAEAEPERWRVIDASRPEDKVWQDVWPIVNSFLAGRNKEGSFQIGKERIG